MVAQDRLNLTGARRTYAAVDRQSLQQRFSCLFALSLLQVVSTKVEESSSFADPIAKVFGTGQC